MDNETAKLLVSEGGTLLFLDFPIGNEFGIDMNVNKTGEKFRGVKMIPPGLHFVHFSTVNASHKSVGPRSGFFQVFKKHDFIAKQWDARDEDISTEPIRDEEIDRYRQSLMGDLDKFLAPYPFEQYKQWCGLTDFITESTLNRLNPSNKLISSMTINSETQTNQPEVS